MLEYLFPENLIAFGIIWVLIGFFSIWFIGLVTYWHWLRAEQKQIENYQNIEHIEPLVNAQQERDRGREDNDQKVDPENTFGEFCEKSSLNSRSPITKHLKAIFVAGWNESRLESSELINHTTSELFKWNNLFRSMLAVFIVIGLLGTLFGLADSLAGLSPGLENSEKMIDTLRKLLDKMKGALGPSIWGITFTIIGVILYGMYLQLACHPVKSILERSTLTVWIPQLYPTTSQKLIQTLQQSESQMQKGFETAAQFSEAVGTVQGNISEFNESLTQAGAITQPLSDSVVQINKAASDISTAAEVLNTGFTENLDRFSTEFASSVNHLTGFQEEIRNLHQQFQETANEKLNEFQEAANKKLDQQIETLNKQDQNLTATVEVLKNCEKLYVESCQQIDNTLQNFLNKTTEANAHIETTNKQFLEGINTRNREWLAEIQNQLKTDLAIIQPTLKEELKTLTGQLTKDLKEVQGTLDEKLTALTNQLKFFQLPIEKTANQIEGVIESFTRIMEGIVNNLQSEFQKQNETIQTLNKKYEEQLTGVRDLNESVKGLLTQLDENSKNQEEAVHTLSTNVGGLTTDIQSLDTAIKSFTSDSSVMSQSIGAIKGHVETLGNASRELVQKADVTPLNTNIEKLNATIEKISQNSQTLADAVNGLERQINVSESEPSPKRSFFSKLNRFFSKLNPLSGRKKDGR